MDLFFYVIPCLIATLALVMCFRLLSRSLRVHGAWNSGLTAEGRVLRTFTTVRGGGEDHSVRTSLHHVYEFTTRDGRQIRFEERNGPSTRLDGDTATVYYKDGADVFATALPPAPGKLLASVLGVLVFLGVMIAFCVGFMVTFSEMADSVSGVFSVTSDF
ncbi:DUF3592 domain-containing protein [Streptomyces sp. NPDC091279]